MASRECLYDSKVIIGGQEFLAYLILLDIHDFDVILGMDWLSRNHATVDCYRKDVRFCKPGEQRLCYMGYGRYYLTVL